MTIDEWTDMNQYMNERTGKGIDELINDEMVKCGNNWINDYKKDEWTITWINECINDN